MTELHKVHTENSTESMRFDCPICQSLT